MLSHRLAHLIWSSAPVVRLGHAMNNDHAELARMTLTPDLRAEAIDRADQVFAWFTDWTHELLAYARQYARQQQALSMTAEAA